MDKNGAPDFNGVAAFGVNADNDVAYMVVMQDDGLTVAKLERDGTRSKGTVAASTVSALMNDVTGFQQKLQPASTDGADCDFALAAVLLGAVVVGVGGVILVGGVAAVSIGSFAGAAAALTGTSTAGVLGGIVMGAGLSVGGYTIVSSSWAFPKIQKGLSCLTPRGAT